MEFDSEIQFIFRRTRWPLVPLFQFFSPQFLIPRCLHTARRCWWRTWPERRSALERPRTLRARPPQRLTCWRTSGNWKTSFRTTASGCRGWRSSSGYDRVPTWRNRNGDVADGSPAQGLELELRNLQVHSHQSESYLVHLDDRLSSLSSSAERNISSLISEVSRTSTWLHNQDAQLRLHAEEKLENLPEESVTALVSKCHWISTRETSGQLSRLRENLDEVNWTVGAVNHTFSSDISFHRLKIQDMQVCL